MIPIRYNVRSLLRRKTTTFTTALSAALVVFIFSAALMIPNGIGRILKQAQHPDISIAISTGANGEADSSFEQANAQTVIAAPQIAQDEKGRPLAAAELVVVMLLEKVGAGKAGRDSETLVRVRGIQEASYSIRPQLHMTEGRRAAPGTNEVVVGRGVYHHFKGLDMDQTFDLGKNRPVKVVGVFESEGSSLESEVWADIDYLRPAMGKEGVVSSVRVKLKSPTAHDAFKATIEGDKRLGLSALREADFVAAEYGQQVEMMQALGFCVSVFFGIGGIISVIVTMHSAVANRRREIGTLQAIGFAPGAILTSFVIESVCLMLAGGLVGALLSLTLSSFKLSITNVVTTSEVAFQLESSPLILGGAIVFAAALGLLGGLIPAVRAAKMNPVIAMKG